MKFKPNYFILTWLYLVATLWFSCTSYAQQLSEVETSANQAMDDGAYVTASEILLNYISKNTYTPKLAYQLAESYRFSNNYINASYWYQYAFLHDTAYLSDKSEFWLASMLKSNASYDSAKFYFKEFLSKYKKDKDWYYHKAENEIKGCELAIKAMHSPINININHLDENVNSPFAEFGAIQLGDSMLLFSSLQQITTNEYGSLFPSVYLSKIWSSKLTAAGYTKRIEWQNRINNSKFHTANITFNEEGTLMIYTQCINDKNAKLRCELYACEKKANEWGAPYRLDNNVNHKEYTSTQPCFSKTSEGTEVLYFVSDRSGGFGGNDIWYSIYKNHHFNDPVNAGSTINTPGDEITPYYHSESQTLYFSSDWLPGLGGFDIFKSKGGLNLWSPPENMGYPLNTACNELYFVVNNSDTDGYFTSNRPGSFFIKGETCCNDIYSWEKLVTKTDTLIHKKDTLLAKTDTLQYQDTIRKLLPLTLYFHNDEPDPSTNQTITSQSYETTYNRYILLQNLYRKEYSKGLYGNGKKSAEDEVDHFFRNELERGYRQLTLFTKLLKKDLEKGNYIAIRVKGYTSPLNNSEYNLNLSKRRISSLVQYLKQCDSGYFNRYMDTASGSKAKLYVYEEPFGKTKSNPNVSDDPNDVRNSIYNPAAALERKIQILYYDSFASKIDDTLQTTSVSIEKAFSNTDSIDAGNKKVYTLIIRNTGKFPLYIKNITCDANNFNFDYQNNKILPAEKSSVFVLFTAPEKEGSFSANIFIYANIPDKLILQYNSQIYKHKDKTEPIKKPNNKK